MYIKKCSRLVSGGGCLKLWEEYLFDTQEYMKKFNYPNNIYVNNTSRIYTEQPLLILYM